MYYAIKIMTLKLYKYQNLSGPHANRGPPVLLFRFNSANVYSRVILFFPNAWLAVLHAYLVPVFVKACR